MMNWRRGLIRIWAAVSLGGVCYAFIAIWLAWPLYSLRYGEAAIRVLIILVAWWALLGAVFWIVNGFRKGD